MKGFYVASVNGLIKVEPDDNDRKIFFRKNADTHGIVIEVVMEDVFSSCPSFDCRLAATVVKDPEAGFPGWTAHVSCDNVRVSIPSRKCKCHQWESLGHTDWYFHVPRKWAIEVAVHPSDKYELEMYPYGQVERMLQLLECRKIEWLNNMGINIDVTRVSQHDWQALDYIAKINGVRVENSKFIDNVVEKTIDDVLCKIENVRINQALSNIPIEIRPHVIDLLSKEEERQIVGWKADRVSCRPRIIFPGITAY